MECSCAVIKKKQPDNLCFQYIACKIEQKKNVNKKKNEKFLFSFI